MYLLADAVQLTVIFPVPEEIVTEVGDWGADEEVEVGLGVGVKEAEEFGEGLEEVGAVIGEVGIIAGVGVGVIVTKGVRLGVKGLEEEAMGTDGTLTAGVGVIVKAGLGVGKLLRQAPIVSP